MDIFNMEIFNMEIFSSVREQQYSGVVLVSVRQSKEMYWISGNNALRNSQLGEFEFQHNCFKVFIMWLHEFFYITQKCVLRNLILTAA
jgi:hypothetical protein